MIRTQIDEFDNLAFSVIFLDEAHKIKNPAANITKAYDRFQCEVRFGLTVRSLSLAPFESSVLVSSDIVTNFPAHNQGTALQNDYNEMWPLLSWSNPGRLGTGIQWRTTIADPLKNGQSHSATQETRDYAVVSFLTNMRVTIFENSTPLLDA